MKTIQQVLSLAPVVCVLALAGCETLTVPDFNNPGLGDVQANPNRSNLATQATGLLVGLRAGQGTRVGYVSELGIIGRESFNFDGADPRFTTELLRDPLNGGNGAFGGNHWVGEYRNIRAANELLKSVDAAEGQGDIVSAEEASGLRGFAKTIQALEFLYVINTRDTLGAPIDVGGDPTADPAPIASKAEVLNHIVSLLDDAKTDLLAAGSAFMFPLGSGFSGFDAPDTFLQVNRALLARVAAYRQDWAGVLTALSESFINDDANQSLSDLEVGAYHAFSQGAGDVTNALFDPSHLLILANPALVTDAQSGDERASRKIITVPVVQDQAEVGLSSTKAFTVYNSLGAPIPIIRNEELLLLRAEANLQQSNLQLALDDINLVRRQSGGLSDISLATWSSGMSQAERIDELLYNRRYSLMFEGHRWIDMRRYGRLDDLLAEDQVTGLVVHRVFPFPTRECDARTPTPAEGC